MLGKGRKMATKHFEGLKHAKKQWEHRTEEQEHRQRVRGERGERESRKI